MSQAASVRTAGQPAVSPADALAALEQGNARFVADEPMRKSGLAELRRALADEGQNPMAVVIGCADSRCPLETVFDVNPGDIFVLRNAGNACTHPEGSIVGSSEFAVGALGTRLLLVMGHTKCGAMVGATKTALAQMEAEQGGGKLRDGSLEGYLHSFATVAREAKAALPEDASVDDIAAKTTRLNVFHTIQKLLEFSPLLRAKALNGDLQLHGAIYDISTGVVSFMGQHPKLDELLCRTAGEQAVNPHDALKILQDGNARFMADKPVRKDGMRDWITKLADHGQNPMAAVIGCADSRCPLETLFDVRPGDLFVLRNAGNACANPEGSVVGSIEFAVGALGTRLVLVVGHTKCGAMVGATKTMLKQLTDEADAKKLDRQRSGCSLGMRRWFSSAKAAEEGVPAKGAERSPAGDAAYAPVREGSLESYLRMLAPVARHAKGDLPESASVEEIAAEATRLNVFVTIQRLLEYSPVLRQKAACGDIELHGALYDIASGSVTFMGQHPKIAELLSEADAPSDRLLGA